MPNAGQGVATIIPHETRSWLAVAVAHQLHHTVAGPLRAMQDGELREMASKIARHARLMPHLLEALGLPLLDGPGFWVGTVLPSIKAELERRQGPPRTWGANSPIARLKALDIATVAERFTTLDRSGNKLKGLCPLHREKTASFYVYPDTQRWHCFGACAGGGDVVDLLQRLAALGDLT